MIRFRIDDSYLELAAGTKLSFKRVNNILKLGDIELSRTASFGLPATPNNNALLQFANDERQYGEKGRRRLTAMMEYSGGQTECYLYVTSADRQQYQCTAVFGELLAFKALKEAGNISEYYLPTDSVLWDDSSPIVVPQQAPLYGIFNYMDGMDAATRIANNVALLPSINVQLLVEAVLQEFNIGATFPTTYTLRAIQPKPKTADGGATFSQTLNKTDMDTIVTSLLRSDLFTTEQGSMNLQKVDTSVVPSSIVIVSQNDYKLFKVVQDLAITFPDDFPSTLYMANIVDNSCTFFGGYGFSLNSAKTTYGDELAGRTIQLQADDVFTFVTKANFEWTQFGTMVYQSGFAADASPFIKAVSVYLDLSDEQQRGDYLYMQKNLPEVTAFDLCRSFAAFYGLSMRYFESSRNLVFFLPYVSEWDVKILEQIISAKNIQRTYGGYVQHNYIRYNSEDYVKDRGAELVRDYAIDNENLDYSKDLFVIPFSEPASDIVRDMVLSDDGTKVEYPLSRHTLGRMNSYLVGQVPSPNALITRLCNAATSLQVQVPMAFYEYVGLDEPTILQLRGKQYVWTDIQWSGGVATINLAQL